MSDFEFTTNENLGDSSFSSDDSDLIELSWGDVEKCILEEQVLFKIHMSLIEKIVKTKNESHKLRLITYQNLIKQS
jgi:hypothetical protein